MIILTQMFRKEPSGDRSAEELLAVIEAAIADPNVVFHQVQRVISVDNRVIGKQMTVVFDGDARSADDVSRIGGFGWFAGRGRWKSVSPTSEQGQKITQYLDLKW